MKHFLSRSLSLLLVFALCLTIFPVTSLASEANTAEEKAQALYELGLFYGKGSNSDGTPNFALQDSATRNEAATMLIRLMGQESKAKSQLVAVPSPTPSRMSPTGLRAMLPGSMKTTMSMARLQKSTLVARP